jgi:hypothetical protein
MTKMMTQPTSEEIKRIINKRTGHAIQSLLVEVNLKDRSIVIEGVATNFYYKQLAQGDVLYQYIGDFQVVNNIKVP